MFDSMNICSTSERKMTSFCITKTCSIVVIVIFLTFVAYILLGASIAQPGFADVGVASSEILFGDTVKTATQPQLASTTEAQLVSTTDIATDAPQTQTVWRMYNEATSEHLWITDVSACNNLTQHGWTQEGRSWDSL